MPHRTHLARLGPSLLALAALAACGGTVDFTLEKDLDVNSTVAAGVVSGTFDLAAEAGGAWKHRDRIDSVSITSGEGTVTSVDTSTNTASAVNGGVWLLPEGVTAPDAGNGSVKIATLTNVPVAVNTVVDLDLSPALDTFVRQAFKGSGRFGVYAQGSGADGKVVACRLHLVLGAKLKWKAM